MTWNTGGDALTLGTDHHEEDAMTTTELDRGRLEAFQQRTVGRYVDAAVTAMIAIGHRTGLFEAAAEGPATSAELAERAGLSERHVREWLGSVATAGVLELDPATGRYSLPPEHALLLTGDTPLNLAAMSPMFTHLAKHVDTVADRFWTGGGIDYGEYRPEFTTVMDELGRRRYDALLVSTYLPLATGLVDRLAAGIRVADVGCGSGHCVNLMAEAFPASTFVGYDLATDAIDHARAEASERGLGNATFEVDDVLQLPTEPGFDLVTAFDAIHDQVDPAGVLRRIHDALRPGGTFYMVDVGVADGPRCPGGNRRPARSDVIVRFAGTA
jgi:hypothetical protein